MWHHQITGNKKQEQVTVFSPKSHQFCCQDDTTPKSNDYVVVIRNFNCNSSVGGGPPWWLPSELLKFSCLLIWKKPMSLCLDCELIKVMCYSTSLLFSVHFRSVGKFKKDVQDANCCGLILSVLIKLFNAVIFSWQ